MKAIGVAASLLLALSCSVDGRAQEKPSNYPRKPIRILVGVFPGGGVDVLSRAAAQMMNDRWGQSAIVDNRPGAGQIIAMNLAAQAVPDGYTFFGASSAILLVGAMKRVDFDLRTAYEPIVRMSSQASLLLIAPTLPIRSVAELVSYAKGRPGALAYGSAGVGTTAHIGMERLKLMAGIDVVHVPFKVSDQAMIAIMAGQIQLIMSNPIAATSFAKSGKLRLLAVTSSARLRTMPETPTVAESGVPGFQLANTYDLYAPGGTPAAILSAVNALVGAGMRSPQMEQRLAAEGAEPGEAMSAVEFKKVISREYGEWVKQASQLKLQVY